MAVVEILKGELAVPLDQAQLEPEVRARFQQFKPYQRAALAQAVYYLIRSGGAADLSQVKAEGSSPYSRDLVFQNYHPTGNLQPTGFRTTVAEQDHTSQTA